MGGTIVLTLIEALLILLALLTSKAIRFISPLICGDRLLVVDDSTKDDVILTQTTDSPPSSHSTTKYDVFLSFKGQDTRHTFASYLYKGLCDAGIHTFMDYKLHKGEHISQVLLRTIEESEISIIIFSENYASSTWCMDELVHILECKEKFGRDVIPIFYKVDPSNIRKQNGSFGKGFNLLKQRFKDNPKKLQKWSDALIQSASLSGWDSNSTSCARPEFKLIEEIVKDILSKLNYRSSYHLTGLVGISRHIINIENLLTEAHIVGIWGMGGAGKTTLAKAIFQVLRAQFDAFSFIENVKEQLERISLDELQLNCLKEILKDEDISIYDIKSTSVKKRLGRKKMLIILDDVDNAIKVEDLTKVFYWCGEGSRIIITSRDIRVLQNAYEKTKPRSTQATYHVPDLDFRDAIHLFSLKAFKQHEPYEGYTELSKSVVEYCQGNPLALVVLGCFLYGREKEEWESVLKKLDNDPPKDIVDVLKLSFDGLDEKQQNVFLDLAFFINERVDISLNLIRQLYDSSALIDISVLKEKSLISCNNDSSIVMHNLVKKIGLKIARSHLIFDDKTTIRLWWHEDIADFFNRGKAIEAIRCMSLDVSMMKSITLRASIFRKIRNLIFLKIYKSDWKKPSMLNIRGVLDYLSEELRFLSWEECPLPYVPLHFCAENLITLNMCESDIRLLWKENQRFPNLKRIYLAYSKHLTALPNLTQIPKIERLYLNGCVNLSQIHSSTFLGNGPVSLCLFDCRPMQIKVGGIIKGRSSGLVIVSSYLDIQNLSFEKVTMKVFVCGNMICGVRFKHEVMPLEDEELRKGIKSLVSLSNKSLNNKYVRVVEWFARPIEFGRDFNQHFEIFQNKRMKKRGVLMISVMKDDEKDDDVLIEDCYNEIHTRVHNLDRSFWLSLKELILKLLPLSREYFRRTKPHLDVTLSFTDITSALPRPELVIAYDVIRESDRPLYPLYVSFRCGLSSWSPDSTYGTVTVKYKDWLGRIDDIEARIERKRG